VTSAFFDGASLNKKDGQNLAGVNPKGLEFTTTTPVLLYVG
jgi:hypothetical protein